MNLEALVATGEVEELRTSAREIGNLLASARRLMKDAGNAGNSRETRLNLSYHVILTLAKVVLRTCGYRLKGGHDEHVRTLNTLLYTLSVEDEKIHLFQTLRKKRNLDLYEGTLEVSDIELSEAIANAEELLSEVEKWLNETSPTLFGD